MGINFHKHNPVENMMVNIEEEGKDNVWKEMEKEKCYKKRIKLRKFFNRAIYLLGKRKK